MLSLRVVMDELGGVVYSNDGWKNVDGEKDLSSDGRRPAMTLPVIPQGSGSYFGEIEN